MAKALKMVASRRKYEDHRLMEVRLVIKKSLNFTGKTFHHGTSEPDAIAVPLPAKARVCTWRMALVSLCPKQKKCGVLQKWRVAASPLKNGG